MAHTASTDGGDAMTDDSTDNGPNFEAAGSELARRLTELEPGDRVLWGDRVQPATVARIVTPGDPIGQALTASVVSPLVKKIQRQRAENKNVDIEDFFLEPGDVFCDPTTWHGMTGKTFAVIQGPRGGFYAIAKTQHKGRARPAFFRAVRSFHQTKAGQPGQGAFRFEGWFDDTLRVVEHGKPPEVLDPEGDLPAYDDIKDNRLVAYDRDESEHYVVGTMTEAFDRGYKSAHEEALAAFRSGLDGDENVDSNESPFPESERVAGNPKTASPVGTVTVTDIVETEYGLKAVIETPPPWETPDDAMPANEVIKSTPWDENHRTFDPDREAWTVDADELTKVAGVFRDSDYVVRAEYDVGR